MAGLEAGVSRLLGHDLFALFAAHRLRDLCVRDLGPSGGGTESRGWWIHVVPEVAQRQSPGEDLR